MKQRLKPIQKRTRNRWKSIVQQHIPKMGIGLKILVILLLTLTATVHANERAVNDTTFRYQNKTITLKDSSEQIKVTVYEKSGKQDSTAYKQIFEGLYSDGKSYEKWMVTEELGFQFPLFKKKRHRDYDRMYAHWDGIGWGFANTTARFLDMTSPNEFQLEAESSHEFFVNFGEKILPLFRNNLGITTGTGFDWRNYHLDNNRHLVETNDVVTTEPAPEGIHYQWSRLRVVYLTFPLLLEWQPALGNKHTAYLSAGVIGGIKTLSSSKVKYVNNDGQTVKKVEDKGLNIAPLTLDYMVEGGIGSLSVYAKYSPFSLFQEGKGPNAKAISLGLKLNL